MLATVASFADDFTSITVCVELTRSTFSGPNILGQGGREGGRDGGREGGREGGRGRERRERERERERERDLIH